MLAKGKLVLLEAPNSKKGEQVFIEGIPVKTSQITYDAFTKVKLKTKGKKVVYKDKPLKTGSEEIRADVGDGAKIC